MPSALDAIASVLRHDSIPEPIATIRVTPAARARAITSSAGSAHASRCACVSVIAASCGGGQVDPRAERHGRPDPLGLAELSVSDVVQLELDPLPTRRQAP